MELKDIENFKNKFESDLFFNIDVKKRKGNSIEWSGYALRNMWKS